MVGRWLTWAGAKKVDFEPCLRLMLLAVKGKQQEGMCRWIASDGAFHRELFQGDLLAQNPVQALEMTEALVKVQVELAFAEAKVDVKGGKTGTVQQLQDVKKSLYAYLLTQLPSAEARPGASTRPLPDARREAHRDVFDAVARACCLDGDHQWGGSGGKRACVHCREEGSAPCGECTKEVDEGVACDKCDKWFHFDCAEVDPEILADEWYCRACGGA